LVAASVAANTIANPSVAFRSIDEASICFLRSFLVSYINALSSLSFLRQTRHLGLLVTADVRI